MNRDILYEIAIKVDDDVLLALYPRYGDEIRHMFDSNLFWKARAEHIAGMRLVDRDANWSRIYYALEDDRSDGLDYLPSLLVLEEVYGMLDWDSHLERSRWARIASPDVLQYLLDTKQIGREPVPNDALISAAENGRMDMILPMYEALKSNGEPEESLAYNTLIAAEYAAREGKGEVMPLLIDLILPVLGEHENVLSMRVHEVLRASLVGGNRMAIEQAMRLYRTRGDIEEAVFDDVHYASPETIQLLIDMDLFTVDELGETLAYSIENGHTSVIEFLHRQGLAPSLDWNRLLRDALQKSLGPSDSYLMYLMSKVDVTRDDELMLRIARKKNSKWLMETMRDAVEGFELADSVFTRSSASKPIEELRRTGAYSPMLRFIFFKRPSGVELLDWMVARNGPATTAAATAVLEDRWDIVNQSIPEQALMRVMLYPTLSVERLLRQMDELGVRNRTAAQLVGSFLGKAEVERRAM